MTIFGVSIILLGGIINFLLVLFQLSSGLRWIKTSPRVHRTTGIILLITASMHGLAAILAS